MAPKGQAYLGFCTVFRSQQLHRVSSTSSEQDKQTQKKEQEKSVCLLLFIMSSQPCYRMFNKHRTIALFPNFPMTSSGIQLDLSFFPLQFCFKGRRTEEHLAVYLGLRHRHLWREHSRWHRWNLQGEQVVACNEKLRDALSQTLFLPIIPFPPSSRLP